MPFDPFVCKLDFLLESLLQTEPCTSLLIQLAPEDLNLLCKRGLGFSSRFLRHLFHGFYPLRRG